jgi:endonuclease YncB( thermonuclease family)
MGRWVASAVALTTCIIASSLYADGADANPVQSCSLQLGPVRTVTRVFDAETLKLDDGRVVRLMGALAPLARDAGAAPGAWPPEQQAITTLSGLVLGQKVRLAFGGRQTDRYGRYLAQLFIETRSGEEWVQGALLAGGHARAYGLRGNFACAKELLAHEELARRRHLGIWSNGVYRTMSAKHPAELMIQRGKYERVIGTVASVGRTKSATYLNFGADWHKDFTARVPKSVLSAHPDFARALDGLASKTIVVRGWIERRNGPLINVADPSQIEFIDKESEPAVASESNLDDAAKPASVPAGVSTPPGSKKLRPAPTEGAEPGAVNL